MSNSPQARRDLGKVKTSRAVYLLYIGGARGTRSSLRRFTPTVSDVKTADVDELQISGEKEGR